MNAVLLIFVGGGIGSVLRYAVTRLTGAALPGMFPWGTLVVNGLGGLLIGALWGWWSARTGGLPDQAGLFLMTGVLGGFTTFSAFSLDAVLLWQKGSPGLAMAYVLASMFLSIGTAVAGISAARALS